MKLLSVSKTLAALSFVAVVAGCSGQATESTDDPAATESDLSAVAVKETPESQSLKNGAFDSLRTLYTHTEYAYQDIQGASAFSFAASPAMSDANALTLAKAIAKKAGYSSVYAYSLKATATSKQLGRVASTLTGQIRADGDDTNSSKLVTAMVKAFALPGKAPGDSIKVFRAIGPGDDHDGDNQDREAIFVDLAAGEALVLQGQSIDR